MKYLLIFEDFYSDITGDIKSIKSNIINKKYIIVQKNNIKKYFILKPYQETEYGSVYCEKLYTIINNKISKNNYQYHSFSTDMIKTKIIFQSNDYQEILDVFKSLLDIDKYNL